MTGNEFEKMMKENGYTQLKLAALWNVHRSTVAERCKADLVEPIWVYALIGLITTRSSQQIVTLLKDARLPSTIDGNQEQPGRA